jgi:hypothetical protein
MLNLTLGAQHWGGCQELIDRIEAGDAPTPEEGSVSLTRCDHLAEIRLAGILQPPHYLALVEMLDRLRGDESICTGLLIFDVQGGSVQKSQTARQAMTRFVRSGRPTVALVERQLFGPPLSVARAASGLIADPLAKLGRIDVHALYSGDNPPIREAIAAVASMVGNTAMACQPERVVNGETAEAIGLADLCLRGKTVREQWGATT